MWSRKTWSWFFLKIRRGWMLPIGQILILLGTWGIALNLYNDYNCDWAPMKGISFSIGKNQKGFFAGIGSILLVFGMLFFCCAIYHAIEEVKRELENEERKKEQNERRTTPQHELAFRFIHAIKQKKCHIEMFLNPYYVIYTATMGGPPPDKTLPYVPFDDEMARKIMCIDSGQSVQLRQQSAAQKPEKKPLLEKPSTSKEKRPRKIMGKEPSQSVQLRQLSAAQKTEKKPLLEKPSTSKEKGPRKILEEPGQSVKQRQRSAAHKPEKKPLLEKSSTPKEKGPIKRKQTEQPTKRASKKSKSEET